MQKYSHSQTSLLMKYDVERISFNPLPPEGGIREFPTNIHYSQK